MNKPKIVEIEWEDSCGTPPIWEMAEDLRSLRPSSIRSVGYLYESNKRFVTISQSLSECQIGRRFTIPRGCIKKMRTLK